MEFEFLDHTADVMFRAYGHTWAEVFEHAALALFASMVDVSRVAPRIKKKITLSAETLEELLYAFLSELVALKDSERLVFSEFHVNIKGSGPYILQAEVAGEHVKPEHAPRADVKAVTYHMLEVGETEEGRKYAQVVLDI